MNAWVYLCFLYQLQTVAVWFTSISAGEDGEFFDVSEIWDAYFFTEVCYHICCQLQEDTTTEVLAIHKKKAGFVCR